MVAGTMGQVSATSANEAPQQLSTPEDYTTTSYVFAVIKNIASTVLIDSGSKISLISEAQRMSIPSLRTKPIQKSYLSATAVTGNYLDTLGMFSITIRLGDEIFCHDVQVVRNTTQSVLLGWDFLKKHHAILDIRAGQLTVGNHAIVPLLRALQTAPLSCSAVTLTPIVIPAMSQMNIMAKVQSIKGEPEDTRRFSLPR